MGQEIVLIWLYKQSLLYPDKKYKSEEIVKEVMKQEEVGEDAVNHSIQRLVFWSFIKRDISVTGWKNSYSITELGKETAKSWIDIENKK